ncbi:uncharacterized protein [Oryza sativa Japonica Group]|uniref:uncharacterized protein n=1 Tax=Oryza sativa subsp. japonica TaxID=39947 RepID=UPI00339CE76F
MASFEAAHDKAAGASLGPTPSGDAQATASGTARDEAAGGSPGPAPSGDAQDQTGPGDIPKLSASSGGPSRVAFSPRRLFSSSSAAPLSAEPLLQALAAANTAVLDGFSAQAACAEEESALRLREDALAERERALEESEAATQRLADSLSLREAAQEEQARRNLECVRAERAALEQRAANLEAREKELDARERSGGAATGESDLVARLAAAEHTVADMQRALDSSTGEAEALRLSGEIGPGMLWDAVSRLDRAGREAGLWKGQTISRSTNLEGLAPHLRRMAWAVQQLPEELEKTIKSSSRDLAQGAETADPQSGCHPESGKESLVLCHIIGRSKVEADQISKDVSGRGGQRDPRTGTLEGQRTIELHYPVGGVRQLRGVRAGLGD